MNIAEFEFCKNKIMIRIRERVCETPEELLKSRLFERVLKNCLKELLEHDSDLLKIFGKKDPSDQKVRKTLSQTLIFLTKMKGDLVPNVVPGSASFFKDKSLFNDFVEYLYNYWRSHDRFIICTPDEHSATDRPYRIFNNTIEHLTHLIRAVYRDIEENITGTHPKIYRQVRAGAEVASIAAPQDIPYPAKEYNKLNEIPVLQQILLYPPLILNPPMNKRTGVFERVDRNPLAKLKVQKKDWLGYPAKVGNLLIMIYIHKNFAELGYSLANLFELAQPSELDRKPDAVYCYGVPKASLKGLGESLTVFYDDEANDMMCAAVPNSDEFGYFGYLKKMVLTLHNIIMMKRGIFPFHGALVDLRIHPDKKATMLLIGDTGAGKSETLEALREFAEKDIKDMHIIADDMGSIVAKKDKTVAGMGTEIGAFLRLDDLKPGYAFGQMDRAIIMSANMVNARIVMPVTNFDRVISEHKIDYILYANNYEEIDDEHPLIEQLPDADSALKVFKEGTVMSKGTTTSTGLVHSYFANIFGPPQYRDVHDRLAAKYFKLFYANKIFVGQMRTRLGIPGYERKGPEEAARALLNIIKKGGK